MIPKRLAPRLKGQVIHLAVVYSMTVPRNGDCIGFDIPSIERTSVCHSSSPFKQVRMR